MMMWVIFLIFAWRVNGFLLFLHADGNTDVSLVEHGIFVNTNNSNYTNRSCVETFVNTKIFVLFEIFVVPIYK